jgi:hypothetical protein
VSKDYFVSVLHDKYSAVAPAVRVRMIRELVAESRENEAFIRQSFPDFYAEAFPAGSKPSAKRRTKPAAAKARSKTVAKRR